MLEKYPKEAKKKIVNLEEYRKLLQWNLSHTFRWWSDFYMTFFSEKRIWMVS
jgi:hypothetical protein